MPPKLLLTITLILFLHQALALSAPPSTPPQINIPRFNLPFLTKRDKPFSVADLSCNYQKMSKEALSVANTDEGSEIASVSQSLQDPDSTIASTVIPLTAPPFFTPTGLNQYNWLLWWHYYYYYYQLQVATPPVVRNRVVVRPFLGTSTLGSQVKQEPHWVNWVPLPKPVTEQQQQDQEQDQPTPTTSRPQLRTQSPRWMWQDPSNLPTPTAISSSTVGNFQQTATSMPTSMTSSSVLGSRGPVATTSTTMMATSTTTTLTSSTPSPTINSDLTLNAPTHQWRNLLLTSGVLTSNIPESASIATQARNTTGPTGNTWDFDPIDLQYVSIFDSINVTKTLTQLPTSGRAKNVPWSGDWWPRFFDGPNYRWNRSDYSPTEKYALAFGKDLITSMKIASRESGIASLDPRRAGYSRCNPFIQNACPQGYQCGFSRVEMLQKSMNRQPVSSIEAYCIPAWFGSCEGWAAAAAGHPEPRRSVRYNNVTFTITDIKGLLSILYSAYVQERGKSYRVGNYCSSIKCDEADFMDINPGMFHLLTTNWIGKQRKSLLLDVKAGKQIWNHPFLDYVIQELRPITNIAELMKLFAETPRTNFTATTPPPPGYNLAKFPRPPSSRLPSSRTRKLVYVKMFFQYVDERSGGRDNVCFTCRPGMEGNALKNMTTEYVLALDDKGEIIGGEWVRQGVIEHPDIMWIAKPPSLEAKEDAEYVVGHDVDIQGETPVTKEDIKKNGLKLVDVLNLAKLSI